jgi:hypothetical protein
MSPDVFLNKSLARAEPNPSGVKNSGPSIPTFFYMYYFV